ncbi:unnamed protein product [Allacma fusca]|uniref:Uncharacterized protein n=1 Tax=Allacma fusca TaxID=39272 RepID=A0A8J2NU82_9HEXA|nr:unnamed protein product [Allacma fusca]
MEARRKVTTQANTDIIPVIDICSSEDEDSANEAWSIVVIKKVVEKELLLDTSAGEIERQCKTWAEVSRKTDQESPLDLTKKRHLVDADLRKNNETKDNQYEESVKRTRPSVITFGGPPTPTHQAELPCERDPTDHFVQALGTDVYRKVFGGLNVSFSKSSNKITMNDYKCIVNV